MSAAEPVAGAAAAAADRLRDAETRLVPCPPVRELLADTDIDAAYAVQRLNHDRRFAAGATLVGRKIGLTSAAVQNQLGVDQPDSGYLFDDMAVVGGVVPAGRLLQPRVEAEIAFWLERDLPGDVGSIDEVATAIGSAVAAIEIVDSRILCWDISIVDTVADNASSGMFVVSEQRVPLDQVDLIGATMSMARNGDVVSTGTGAACLGHPLNAVLWLARASARLGRPLRAGELVLSGALGPLVPVTAGDAVRAEITGLGSVEVQFAGEE
jgi:2-keto-4-pentenoate hydratase